MAEFIQRTEDLTVPMELFGRDHWSVFAYIETVCVDRRGAPDLRRMRCDSERRPGLAHCTNGTGKRYPTRLKDGRVLYDHDDWDCADDLEGAGLIEIGGSGMNPVFKLTPRGWEVGSALRQHRASGAPTDTFVFAQHDKAELVELARNAWEVLDKADSATSEKEYFPMIEDVRSILREGLRKAGYLVAEAPAKDD